ncbi:hypothetical protein ACIG5E_16900 [Kitasatospora sp. NPDC053057]|uniref:hypothetical protein n=1 Tax=Kitasatospora sp. NPDC053057 TaxID=3364062 RepID=UPI0037C850EC
MTTAPDLNVTFYDHLQPKATAGVYTVSMKHRLTVNGDPVETDGARLPEVADRYEIRAAQFVLDPAWVHASYPPADAAGLYTHVLPHITLNRAILPWERELQGRGVVARAAWLALLVFAEGEVLDDPDAEGAFSQRTVRELLQPGPGLLGPRLSGELDESVECRTIDVPAAVFTAVVPREDELLQLAHVRDVRTAPQRRDNGEILTEGDYAVLAANRFPRAEGRYAVHLVSLEGWIGRLESLPGGTQHVRLCTLWSWSFTNDPDGSLNPAKLLANLVEPAAEDREELALRLRPAATGQAASPEEEYARERLHHGYTAVPYRTLSGEHTYAWYRGPLTPLTAPTVPWTDDEAEADSAGPYTTADHALIYDREHGLFDVSYAAAWTLGRTIALADPDYSAEVIEARREMANRAATLSALSADRRRALHDPDALPASTALRELADAGFGRGLVRALKAPLAPEPRRSRAARPTRREAPALLADARTRQSLSSVAAARTPTAAAWLERLGLLRGVPFNHLVPDPRMLPPESLRLFRVDPGWIKALVAGASDVGAHTSIDRDLDEVLRARLTRTLGTGEPVAGLLMNSELVRAWPVFDILATTGTDQTPVNELRRDHLAPDVLLVLWDEVPDRIAIREPGQGIHFGINDQHRINLRHLDGDTIGERTGDQFPATGAPDIFAAHLRDPLVPGRAEADVLDLRSLLPALKSALALAADPTPAQFALELVNAPLEQLLLPANNA